MRSSKEKRNLNQIINKYVSGSATAEERKFVEAYYEHLNNGKNILEQISVDELLSMESSNFNAILNKIDNTNQKQKGAFNYRYIVAALILISLSIGGYFTFKTEKQVVFINQVAKKIDVLPGSAKAILTLSDGSKIELDNKNGEVQKSANLTISKTEDGQLIYKVLAKNKVSPSIAYNTIETPKGGQYQVLLQDGTKVWLNAASKLKYPEVFDGTERKVELTGEAYFEVAKNKLLPFRVVSKNQLVEVLGTHFNVNNYPNDQQVKTTLLEGSIKISNGNSSKILKPGEQARVANDFTAKINVLSSVDTEDEVAWKNGQFRFSNAGLKSILNQLERWYDIKIDYATVPDRRFNGMVPRKAKLSEVLNMLELTGNIKFEIKEGRQLKVIAK